MSRADKPLNVLLLRPIPKSSVCSSVPPLGLGYVARSLLDQGIGVDIVDMGNRKVGPKALSRRLGEGTPDLVGIQVYSREIRHTQGMIDEVRKQVGRAVPIVAGGPHPSTMPERVFDHLKGIDFAIAGEGEEGVPLLTRYVAGDSSVDVRSIPGLVYRTEGRVQVNPKAFADDIDRLGWPAWDVMHLDGYETEVFGGGFTRRKPAMTLLTSRGCPYKCTFCCAKYLGGERLRLRSPRAVVDEMAILRYQWGFQEIKIIDDNFNADRRHVLGIGEALRENPVDVSVSFACGLHLHNIDDEVLTALRAMGAYELMIAIESGSQRVLDVMRKRIDLKEVPGKVECIRRHGFAAISFFIIGFPGETVEEIDATVDLALRLPLTRVHLNCFSPFPGSEIFENLVAQGKLDDFDLQHVHFETINYSYVDGVSAVQLNRIRQRALLRFYLRPRILFGLWRTFRQWSSMKFLLRKSMEYFGIVR